MLGNVVSPQKPFAQAARYVRMSTEHQQYSIENQSDVIATYAESQRMLAGVASSSKIGAACSSYLPMLRVAP
jgi:DNA invertase Pin-like site-specific DNA recombinase